MAAQTSHPVIQDRPEQPTLMDGQAVKSGIDRYQKSFDTPPLTNNVFGAGSGVNSSAR
jgi:hypothetical protein